jgi:hypothetical protein
MTRNDVLSHVPQPCTTLSGGSIDLRQIFWKLSELAYFLTPVSHYSSPIQYPATYPFFIYCTARSWFGAFNDRAYRARPELPAHAWAQFPILSTNWFTSQPAFLCSAITSAALNALRHPVDNARVALMFWKDTHLPQRGETKEGQRLACTSCTAWPVMSPVLLNLPSLQPPTDACIGKYIRKREYVLWFTGIFEDK